MPEMKTSFADGALAPERIAVPSQRKPKKTKNLTCERIERSGEVIIVQACPMLFKAAEFTRMPGLVVSDGNPTASNSRVSDSSASGERFCNGGRTGPQS